MNIEGTITAVQESWPLELVVETEDGRRHVALRSDTVITADGKFADPHALIPGVRVRIEGAGSGPAAVSASLLEIV